MGAGRDPGNRIDRPEHIGRVHDGDDLALGDDPVEIAQVQASGVRDRQPLERRAGAPRKLLPRNEIGVVLHLGDDNLVTGRSRNRWPVPATAAWCVGEGIGGEVERLGRVLREHHFVRGRADEAGDRGAGGFASVPPRRARAPRCGAALRWVYQSLSASSTAYGFCEVAPSRGRPAAGPRGRCGPRSGNRRGCAPGSLIAEGARERAVGGGRHRRFRPRR